MTDASNEVQFKKPIFGNITYDVLSDIVNLGFPGVAALYAAVALIWGLPFSEQVVATVAAVVVFLGILLKISSKRWQNRPYDGEFVANDPDPDANTYRAIFDKGLPTLGAQDEVRLKVVDLSRGGTSQ